MEAAVTRSSITKSTRLFSDDDLLNALSFTPAPTSAICKKLNCSYDTTKRHLNRLYKNGIIERTFIKYNTNIGKIYMWNKYGLIETDASEQYSVCKQCKTLKNKNKFSTLHGKYQNICKECTNENHRRQNELKKLTSLLEIKEKELIDFKGSSFDENFNSYKVISNDIKKINKRIHRIKNWKRIRNTERDYQTTIPGIISKRKACSKRRRLGFNPINKYFKGSEYHHLRYDSNGQTDEDVGIFIPKQLHRSVSHNGSNGVGMDEINKLAIEWYRSIGGSI